MSLTGFIGLGIMGKGMVKNLIIKFPEKNLIVWNRSAGPAEELLAAFPDRVSVIIKHKYMYLKKLTICYYCVDIIICIYIT